MFRQYHQLNRHESEKTQPQERENTEKPGMLQSLELQRVRQNVVTEQKQETISLRIPQAWKEVLDGTVEYYISTEQKKTMCIECTAKE